MKAFQASCEQTIQESEEGNMGRWLRAATVSGVVATALVVAVATAMAGNTRVSGTGVYAEACTPPALAGDAPADTGDYPVLVLEGSLVGCWYTYVETAKSTPSGSYQETGTELFVGCLNGTTCGTFTTTYTFTGKFAASGEEIHGRCQHPVTGTTGGFAGMSGVIQFKDDVDTGIFYYRGNINS
jgi:hypothetical protein